MEVENVEIRASSEQLPPSCSRDGKGNCGPRGRRNLICGRPEVVGQAGADLDPEVREDGKNEFPGDEVVKWPKQTHALRSCPRARPPLAHSSPFMSRPTTFLT